MTVNELIEHLIKYQRLIKHGGYQQVKIWNYDDGIYEVVFSARENDIDDMNLFCELCF
jgi:hypothetical protein